MDWRVARFAGRRAPRHRGRHSEVCHAHVNPDSDWDTDRATRARVLRLLDYIDRDDDLIADREPIVGLLDDVLLIELAWPAFSAEADEYRDFCRYRDDEHPAGNGDAQRHAWIRDRIAEITLWQHHLRVNGSYYAHSGDPPLRFRVG